MITNLNLLPLKTRAIIIGINEKACKLNPYPPSFLEKRLLEMGFVEGTPITILHQAPFTKDPIIIQLRNSRIALRRNEAECIEVSYNDKGE